MELLAVSVGVGLVIGLLCSEVFGIAAGGLIVPGYIALYLTKPGHILATLAVALATFATVKVISTFLIVHGRRRTALMILVGYLLGVFVGRWSGVYGADFATIGFIIPGLMAMWMDRQGVPQTLGSMLIVSTAVRLVLVIAGELTS